MRQRLWQAPCGCGWLDGEPIAYCEAHADSPTAQRLPYGAAPPSKEETVGKMVTAGTAAKVADINAIPSLFMRGEDGCAVPTVTPGCDWVLNDKGICTIKVDGVQVWVDREGKITYREQVDGFAAVYVPLDLSAGGGKGAGSDLEWALRLACNNYRRDCLNNAAKLDPGVYQAYGPSLPPSNPHKAIGHNLAKLVPVEFPLIVSDAVAPLRRGQTVVQLFETLRQYLEDSPEIAGFVYHLEDTHLKAVAYAKVEKADFGLPWPPPSTAAKETK